MNGHASAEEKLEAVLTGARAILEKRCFPESARAIFDQARAMTGATAGYVALLSEDGAENELLFLEAGGMPCTVDENLPMPIRGLRAVSYETGKAAYDNDFMNSRWTQYMPDGHVELKNVMFAPLNIDGKTVGIMGLANKPSDFTPEDAEIACAFGDLAAIGLANSRYLDLLNEKTEALARSNEDLDDFAYAASHDLKEPLRGINTYSAFLLEDYEDKLDEEGRTRLQTLARLSERMQSQVETLLEYSRVGRAEVAIAETDLNKVVAETVDSLRVSLDEHKVDIRISPDFPVLRCDGARAGQVFYNLIINAMKYNDKEEKQIEVGWNDGGDEGSQECPRYVFHVRDNGIGIDERHYDQVFGLFKRLHKREGYGGGTGAGLAIVKKIVERQGGRIWLASKPGEGTTFFFTLDVEGSGS